VTTILNRNPQKRAYRAHSEYQFKPDGIDIHDFCGEEVQSHHSALNERSNHFLKYQMATSPGYNTSDDFGNDGDDTIHTPLDHHVQPSYVAAKGSFPADGSLPQRVDLVFASFLEQSHAILPALLEAGASYSDGDISLYLPAEFHIGSALIEYAKMKWQRNVTDCSIDV
jgi:hypothetical protein